ncbi:hypothetical protein IFM89_025129 [Coptis chinensis]|uniref:BAG domain-containing protein n=1 Tax=Coptis chinensis TaxID=261450 RepID=A0A835MFX2_9MAGN|nr:hypothetical protein IFM89_025129 [Coptis chinensis]
MRKTAKMEKAAKFVSEISLKVDKLAGQVSALESVITKGGKVNETDVWNLIELLMNQLVKLDAIMVDGDVKLQRRMQVKRVQKYVETLDLLKIRIPCQVAMEVLKPEANPERNSVGRNPNRNPKPTTTKKTTVCRDKQSTAGGVVVTTKWETFDHAPPLIPYLSTSATTTTPANKLTWEFFE